MGKDGFTKQQVFANESSMRKEFNTGRDLFDSIVRSYQTIANADNSGAGDQARIFSYMKMLDPRSMVSEGEQATAQNAAGVESYIRSMYNRLIGGGTLDTKARREIEDQARKLYEDSFGEQTGNYQFYSDAANRYGIDPRSIVGKPTKLLEPKVRPPEAGAVKYVDGVKYIYEE